MRTHITCLLLFLIPQISWAQNDNPLLGLWKTENHEAVVQFYQCDKKFCGRFYWLKDDTIEAPSLDEHNPAPDKRNQPLCGLTFLGDFVAEKEGDYANGWIYSPRHGGTYSAALHLTNPNLLEVRGYMFFPFLGGGQIWTRLIESPTCRL